MKKYGKIKLKICIILLLTFILSMMLTSCQTYEVSFKNFKDKFFPEEVKSNAIKIAVYEPITGEYSAQGALETKGIELAHSIYPTVNGKDVELVYLDNKSDMYEGEEILNNVLDSSFSGLIGSYGDVLTLVAANKVRELEIPGMSVTSTNNLITESNPFYFTTTYRDDNQAEELAKYVSTDLNKSNIALVRIDGDDATLKIADDFNQSLKDSGKSKAKEYIATLEQTDFQEMIYKMIKAKYDSVILLLPINASKDFINQAIGLSFTPLFVGTRTWDNDDMSKFLEGIKANSCYCTEEIIESSKSMGNRFLEGHKAMYGISNTPETETAIAFDSYVLLIRAIEKAYNDNGMINGTLIRDALLETTDYHGASGTISYEGSNVATKPISVKLIKNLSEYSEKELKDGGIK